MIEVFILNLHDFTFLNPLDSDLEYATYFISIWMILAKMKHYNPYNTRLIHQTDFLLFNIKRNNMYKNMLHTPVSLEENIL